MKGSMNMDIDYAPDIPDLPWIADEPNSIRYSQFYGLPQKFFFMTPVTAFIADHQKNAVRRLPENKTCCFEQNFVAFVRKEAADLPDNLDGAILRNFQESQHFRAGVRGGKRERAVSDHA